MQSDPCLASKPGDETDPLIFPWDSTERIFSESDEPDPSDYGALYSSIQRGKSALLLSIILSDAADCVGYVSAVTGDVQKISDDFTDVETLKECMKRPIDELPVIVALLGRYVFRVAPFDKNSLDMKEFLGYKLYGRTTKGVPLAYFGKHSNVIIIDRREKVIERFEPHGTGDPEPLEDDAELEEFIGDELVDLLTESSEFDYCGPTRFCPSRGPQKITRDEWCYGWSMFYLHLRLKNPGLSRGEIFRRLVGLAKERPSPLLDWLDVIQSTIEELQDPLSPIYSADQKQKVSDMVIRNNPSTVEDTVRLLLEAKKRYKASTEKKVRDFFSGFTGTGGILLPGKGWIYRDQGKYKYGE